MIEIGFDRAIAWRYLYHLHRLVLVHDLWSPERRNVVRWQPVTRLGSWLALELVSEGSYVRVKSLVVGSAVESE